MRHSLAGIAQLVEHLFCKQKVRGSSPSPAPLQQPFWGVAHALKQPPVFRYSLSYSATLVALDNMTIRSRFLEQNFGGLPERPMGADCKSAGLCLRKVRILHPPPKLPVQPIRSGSAGHGPRPRPLRLWPSGSWPGSSAQPRLCCAGVAQLVELQPSKLNVAEFESRLPLCSQVNANKLPLGNNPAFAGTLHFAHLAQLVEHVIGNDGVVGSNPMVGSAPPVSALCSSAGTNGDLGRRSNRTHRVNGQPCADKAHLASNNSKHHCFLTRHRSPWLRKNSSATSPT